LTQLDQQGAWSAQMFWSFAASERFMGHQMPPSTAPMLVEIDPNTTDLSAATDVRLATNLGPMFRDHDLAVRLHNVDDWGGETQFLIATLALMNSRNASEIELTEPNNKRRRLLGKPLLYSYHLVCIPPRYKQRYIPAADEDRSEHISFADISRYARPACSSGRLSAR
jgi:hypothetical protein